MNVVYKLLQLIQSVQNIVLRITSQFVELMEKLTATNAN